MPERVISLLDPLSEATAADLIPAAALVLIVGAVAAESAWRWRAVRYPGRRLGVAVALGIGGLVVSSMLGGAMAFAFVQWQRLAPDGLADLWSGHPMLAWLSAFVAFDALGHLHHRIGHGTAVGWAAHAPHHSDRVFELSLALRQSWVPIHGVAILPMIGIGGWSFDTVLVCAAISNLLQALQHVGSAPALPRGLRAVVITPAGHRVHHEGDGSANFGPIFTAWDRLGGTYRSVAATQRAGRDTDPQEPRPNGTRPVSVLEAQFAAWRQLIERKPA